MMRKKKDRGFSPIAKLESSASNLLGDIRSLIEKSRIQVAQVANAALTLLYWQVGDRIRRDILKHQRAQYGKEIVSALSRQLTAEYGRGFSRDNLFRMIQFAERFSCSSIVGALSRQLTWSHFVELIPLEDPIQRDFYTEMCRVERWSVRTLRRKIASMLYERTALSRKPAELARLELQALREEDRMTPDMVFRDPYLLDFLGLQGAYQEKDLEAAILRELETFIMELGTGFTFVARQKRITVDHEDFYLDLLFFHRDLRRLVAIELKLGKFLPDHKGQMELYLRWLDKHDRKPGEDSPLGVILCAAKKSEQIELLELGRAGIHVAEYLTALPPRDVLKRKLHEAITRSRLVLENRVRGTEPAEQAVGKPTAKPYLDIPQETRKQHRRPASPKKSKAKTKRNR